MPSVSPSWSTPVRQWSIRHAHRCLRYQNDREKVIVGNMVQQRRYAMGNEKRNMELMQTLDDSWNAQDWETFDKRHRDDVVVRWPAQPPTHGRHDHRAESIRLFKTFPDNRVHNRPY